jgi:hypothetical protein
MKDGRSCGPTNTISVHALSGRTTGRMLGFNERMVMVCVSHTDTPLWPDADGSSSYAPPTREHCPTAAHVEESNVLCSGGVSVDSCFVGAVGWLAGDCYCIFTICTHTHSPPSNPSWQVAAGELSKDAAEELVHNTESLKVCTRVCVCECVRVCVCVRVCERVSK